MATSDNAELAEVLTEARELESVRKDAVKRLGALRTYSKAILATGRGSQAQQKAWKEIFPARGRAASK